MATKSVKAIKEQHKKVVAAAKVLKDEIKAMKKLDKKSLFGYSEWVEDIDNTLFDLEEILEI